MWPSEAARIGLLRSHTTTTFLQPQKVFSAKAQRIMSVLVHGIAGQTTDDQTDANARRHRGEFVRGVSTARNWVTDDPNAVFPVEMDRYHLYVAYNCPWCHRVLLGRALMGLQDAITVDVLFPNRSNEDEPMGPNLWKFEPEGQVGQNGVHVSFPSCTRDTVLGKKYVPEIYQASGVEDQKSVPILFDKKSKQIVNNESAEILRMLGTVFGRLGSRGTPLLNLYPAERTKLIDEHNDWIYKDIANGSYKAGFSSNQEVYEKAYHTFFEGMDKLDEIFAQQTFLTGEAVTEADVRLFPPLFRLDPIYYSRFKLNKAYLWEYPHIWRWMRSMMTLPDMDEVTNSEYLQHCKQGYFGRTGNGTIPVGPPGYPESYKEKHPTHM
jgi:putative glutathione S-transferase